MGRSFIRRADAAAGFGQRLDVSRERFANSLKPIQLFLLLKNSFVQFLDKVFLKGNFCFDVD